MVLFAAIACLPAALMSNLGYQLFGEPEQPLEAQKSDSMGWHLFPAMLHLHAQLVV